MPHYTMVTFLHTPYAVALERTELQRRILEQATAGHDSLEHIDWAALEAQIATTQRLAAKQRKQLEITERRLSVGGVAQVDAVSQRT
ncbi:hypothetical protein KC220_22485, partial [Mycobacterium tuberculosis]|nr:hypothetical protein [Mycobacterium tuberculosis]